MRDADSALFFLMPTMRLKHLLALATAGFVSWLGAFAFQCYCRGLPGAPSVHPRDHKGPYPGATSDNLFWFMQVCCENVCVRVRVYPNEYLWPLQVSDIHLSIANNFEVREDLRTFCSKTVPTISPALVLVTGECPVQWSVCMYCLALSTNLC